MNQLTPREIVRELDRYIVGQEDAKRAVAVELRAAVAVALGLSVADKIDRGHIVLLHVFDHSEPL